MQNTLQQEYKSSMQNSKNSHVTSFIFNHRNKLIDLQKLTLKFVSLALNKPDSPRISLLKCTNSAQAFRVYYFAVWFAIWLFCLIGLSFIAVVNICIYVSLKCTLKSSKTTATKSNFSIKTIRNKWYFKCLSCI